MDPITLMKLGMFLFPLLGKIGSKDYPDLKDEQGVWLTMHYSQHCRASAGDLTEIWLDGHTICDDTTGVPLARWSKGQQKVIPITGFTIQGMPVYEDVPSVHPVWTTKRAASAALGSPGSSGEKTDFYHGVLKPPLKVMECKGEKVLAVVGQYGPFSDGIPAPTPPLSQERGAQSGGAQSSLSGIGLLGAAALAVAGAWTPAAVLGVLSLLSGVGSGVGSSPGRSGGSSGGRGESSGGSGGRQQPGTGRGGRYIPPSLPPSAGSYVGGSSEDPYSPY
jgi:hypothetical protein